MESGIIPVRFLPAVSDVIQGDVGPRGPPGRRGSPGPPVRNFFFI